MAEPKKKAAKKKKNKGGRPSDYRAAFAREAEKLMALGATLDELADFFDVSLATIKRWIEKHSGFRAYVCKGRIKADAEVADSLYRRACGYRHRAVKIFCSDERGVTKVPYTEQYPPDTQACIKWLTNRRPHQWKDKVVVENTKGGLAERLKRARQRVQEKAGGAGKEG